VIERPPGREWIQQSNLDLAESQPAHEQDPVALQLTQLEAVSPLSLGAVSEMAVRLRTLSAQLLGFTEDMHRLGVTIDLPGRANVPLEQSEDIARRGRALSDTAGELSLGLSALSCVLPAPSPIEQPTAGLGGPGHATHCPTLGEKQIAELAGSIAVKGDASRQRLTALLRVVRDMVHGWEAEKRLLHAELEAWRSRSEETKGTLASLSDKLAKEWDAADRLMQDGLAEPLQHLSVVTRQVQASPMHGQLIQGAAGAEVANLLLVCQTYVGDLEGALSQLLNRRRARDQQRRRPGTGQEGGGQQQGGGQPSDLAKSPAAAAGV